jgi:hypothetical protein
VRFLIYAEVEPHLEVEPILAVLDAKAYDMARGRDLMVTGRQVTNAETGPNRVVVWSCEEVK